MKHTLFAFSIFLLPVLSGCDDTLALKVDKTEVAGSDLTPGFHRTRSTLSDGRRLLYAYWIPQNVQPAAPLVVALHYAGAPTDYRGEVFLRQLVQPALGAAGAIIVAPDVLGDSWIRADCETAVMSLVEAIKETWPVDSDRTVVVGYSLGGIGAWFLADKYPEEFILAVPMASEPVGFLSGRVPHYVIQGMYDELFGTKAVKKAVAVLQINGGKAELVIAPDLSHYQANAYVSYLRAATPWFIDTTQPPPSRIR